MCVRGASGWLLAAEGAWQDQLGRDDVLGVYCVCWWRTPGAVLRWGTTEAAPPKKTVKIPFWRPPEFKFPLLGGIFESPNLILTLDGTTAMVGELGRPLSPPMVAELVGISPASQVGLTPPII